MILGKMEDGVGTLEVMVQISIVKTIRRVMEMRGHTGGENATMLCIRTVIEVLEHSSIVQCT